MRFLTLSLIRRTLCSDKRGILRALFKANDSDVNNVRVACLQDDGTWGSGFSDTCSVKIGVNIITFESLFAGYYHNKQLEIQDLAGNLAPIVDIPNFTITVPNLFVYIPSDKKIDSINICAI